MRRRIIIRPIAIIATRPIATAIVRPFRYRLAGAGEAAGMAAVVGTVGEAGMAGADFTAGTAEAATGVWFLTSMERGGG